MCLWGQNLAQDHLGLHIAQEVWVWILLVQDRTQVGSQQVTALPLTYPWSHQGLDVQTILSGEPEVAVKDSEVSPFPAAKL